MAGAKSKGLFAGTATLFGFMLRRDRIKLPAWVGGIGLFIVYVVSALPVAFPTQQEMAAAVHFYAGPMGRMLVGPGYGFDNPSIEQVVANGYSLYLLILVALMSIFLVIRHTRQEEQTGRAELVRANVVGRYALLTATMGVAVITNTLVAIVVFLLMIGLGGFDAGGSLLFAAGAATTGLAFAGIAAVTVQLSQYSRVAAGMAGAVLGGAFVLRAGGDMAAEGGSALSWLSPLAWAQQTAPFVLNRWWPLLLPLLLFVVTVAIGYALSARRDLGAGLVAVRPGAASAKPALGTPLGLSARLQRSSIIGWTAAVAVSGFVFGAFANSMMMAANDMPPTFLKLFGGSQGVVDGYLAYMVVFMAYLASVYAILSIQALRAEETSGRLDPVLATPVSRVQWLVSNLMVTICGVILIMIVTGAATGVGAAVVTGDQSYIPNLVVAHINQIPAVLVVLGIASLLFGILPRFIGAAWLIVVLSLFFGTFGRMFDVPQAILDLSPFEHPASMPIQPFSVEPFIGLLVIAAVAAAAGLIGIRRRAINI